MLGYTGPIERRELAELKSQGYLPDDLIGKTGVESTYETQLRGTYGSETVERDAPGRRSRSFRRPSRRSRATRSS